MARRTTAARAAKPAAAAPSSVTKPNAKAAGRFSVAKAWSPILARTRHVAIVRGFLHEYSTLNPPLTSGEALFVIHLMDFKWGEEAPWPSYRKLAKRMGVSDKMVRRHAQSLATKGYLMREVRRAQTNRFHLNGLFRALEKHLALKPRRRRREHDEANP